MRKSHRQARRIVAARMIESLECRRLLSTVTWVGGGSDDNFSTGANWQGGVAPQAGDNLVFSSLGTSQTVNVDGSSPVNVGSVTVAGTYTFNDQPLSLAGNLEADAASNVTFTDGIDLLAPISVTVDSNASLTLNPVITSADIIVSRYGDGTMNLECDGFVDWTLHAGTTNVGTDGGQHDVFDLEGGKLAGFGAPDIVEVSGGTFAPTAPSGSDQMTIEHSLAMSGGTYAVTLGSGSEASLLSYGTDSISGAQLSLSLGSGFTPSNGTVYTILDNQSGTAISGTFANLPEGSTVRVGSHAFRISYVGAGQGKSITLTDITMTPTVVLSASSVTPTPNTPITLTAMVSGSIGTPGGTVSFLDGSTTIGTATLSNGVAALSDVKLAAGTHSITAIYGGSSAYVAGSSSAATIATVSAGPTITVGSNAVLDTAKATSLSVSATDLSTNLDDGLTYTWSIVKMPSGAKKPAFTVNGTHAASDTIASFSKDGTYHFRVTVTDGDGLTATSDVDYLVRQKPRGLRVTPHGAKVDTGDTLQFSTTALDQFSHPMRVDDTPEYVILTGTGSINETSGLFTASTKKGKATVQVTLDGLVGTIATTVV